MTKKEHIDGIGEVTFVKTKRTKNLRISMSPHKGVRVSVPNLMSFRKAFSFVIESLCSITIGLWCLGIPQKVLKDI